MEGAGMSRSAIAKELLLHNASITRALGKKRFYPKRMKKEAVISTEVSIETPSLMAKTAPV